MSAFQYPTLSPPDIVTVLEESQIATISTRDLGNPNYDFVYVLYSNVLLYLDYTEEDNEQVDFEALDHLENPDLHVDSVRIMNMCKKIREVLTAVECPQKFSLKDIVFPDPRRTQLFLSSILNFCIHKNTKMELLKPIEEEVSLLANTQSDLESEISQLNDDIIEFNKTREKDIPFVQEKEAKAKELHHAIAGLNTQQMSLRNTYKDVKEKSQEMDEKICNAEFALVQVVQENANLRSQIVQSPEKLQMALDEKKSIAAEATKAKRSVLSSFQENTATLEVYTKALKKLSKHIVQMQATQEQVSSAKSSDKDLKVLKDKIRDEEVLVATLETKLIEMQDKAEHLSELHKQLEIETRRKCEDSSRDLENVKSEVESKKQELGVMQRKVEAMVSEVDSGSSRMNSVKESGWTRLLQLANKGEEVVKQFLYYLASVVDLSHLN